MGVLDRRGEEDSTTEDFLLQADEDRSARGQDPVRIRGYRPQDREAVRQICWETGFLGRPIDPIFRDRLLFADLFTRPYLEHEPGWAFVAEADGHVVGYLLGSVSPAFNRALFCTGFKTTCRILFNAARGRYACHRRSIGFIRWLLTSGLAERPNHPAGAAHLHFDLRPDYRGRGIGRRLWNTFEWRLREIGCERCYGEFFSFGRRRPELAYARFGFQVFDRRETTLFWPEIRERVEVVCVEKRLNSAPVCDAEATA